jgi:hypothetical protein
MLGLLAVALGAPPDGLRPVAAPWDTPERWAAHQSTSGQSPDPLACRVLVEGHARLCLRQQQGEGLRWVTESQVKGWETTTADALASIDTRAALSKVEEVPVPGLQGTYLRLVSGEGLAVALALHADELVARLGPELRVALPAGTVALAWSAGDPSFDQAMAVGVVELAEEQPGEVSRTVFRYDGAQLVPWAEAKQPAPAPRP